MAWSALTGAPETRWPSATFPPRNISSIPDCGSSPDSSPCHTGSDWRSAGELTGTGKTAEPIWNSGSLPCTFLAAGGCRPQLGYLGDSAKNVGFRRVWPAGGTPQKPCAAQEDGRPQADIHR